MMIDSVPTNEGADVSRLTWAKPVCHLHTSGVPAGAFNLNLENAVVRSQERLAQCCSAHQPLPGDDSLPLGRQSDQGESMSKYLTLIFKA